MSHYNTGIGSNIPSVLDLTSAGASFVADFVQLITGQAQTSFEAATLVQDHPGTYNPATHSWSGADGLSYRVPLISIPSERHAREKTRNIKLLMDNCRRICVHDELPSTLEERKFWISYRFMKYQMVLGPACLVVPPTYVFWKVCHRRIPSWLQGRSMPIFLGLAVAEMWGEATYPGHQLLSRVLRAQTPLGDAARAEWLRLQPLDIPFHVYSAYQFQHFFDSVPAAYGFGGDLASLCS